MRVLGFIAIISTAAACMATAGAQDVAPAERAARPAREPIRYNAQPIEVRQPQAPETGGSRVLSSRPPADSGWQWSFDDRHPSLNYSVNDNATLRLRSTRGGAGVYLNWRF